MNSDVRVCSEEAKFKRDSNSIFDLMLSVQGGRLELYKKNSLKIRKDKWQQNSKQGHTVSLSIVPHSTDRTGSELTLNYLIFHQNSSPNIEWVVYFSQILIYIHWNLYTRSCHIHIDRIAFAVSTNHLRDVALYVSENP